jgi:alpha-amylase/alpha-mannosidase (GH57 family)
MNCETDYYMNLINEFYNISGNIIQKQFWKDQKIIELTRILRETGNMKFFQNSLVFIMSLFSDTFLDTYECESKYIDDLIDSEKELLKATLKLEVI